MIRDKEWFKAIFVEDKTRNLIKELNHGIPPTEAQLHGSMYFVYSVEYAWDCRFVPVDKFYKDYDILEHRSIYDIVGFKD